jgi:GGDEF domain-containing protein
LFDIATRLSENTRRVDSIGRLGDEEFAVCLPAISLEE